MPRTRAYQDFTAADAIMHEAMRNSDNHFPDLTPPRISTRRFTWMTLLGLVALVGAAALAIAFA